MEAKLAEIVANAKDLEIMDNILDILRGGWGNDEAQRIIKDVWIPEYKINDPKKKTSVYFVLLQQDFMKYEKSQEYPLITLKHF